MDTGNPVSKPPSICPPDQHPGETSAVPASPPGPPNPYRNLGFRIGKYVRQIFEADPVGIQVRVQGRVDREEMALAEGIALGSGCIPSMIPDGGDEICEVRCIFTVGAKRIIVIPAPLRIPSEVLHNTQVYEDFAGWLLVQEDNDLFEVRFG